MQGQQPGPFAAHKGRGNVPLLPASPSSAQAPHSQRNYTAPGAQRVGRAPSVVEGKWPSAEPTRSEHENRAPSTSPGKDTWHGGRHGKGRGRGGAPGQRGDGAFSQQLGDAYHGNSVRDERTGWGRLWRPQAGPHNEAYAHAECRNNHPHARFSYKPCSCAVCQERNRGVYVSVHERPEYPLGDLQTRLRLGMAAMFGPVEIVIRIPRDGLGFVVR